MKSRDFRVRRAGKDRFSYLGIDHHWTGMQTSLLGGHQVDNASLTLAACEILMRGQDRLTKDHIQSGLVQNHWPGPSGSGLPETPTSFWTGRTTSWPPGAWAVSCRTPWPGGGSPWWPVSWTTSPTSRSSRIWWPRAHDLIITRPKIDRSLPPEIIEAAADRPLISDIETIPDVGDAVRHAIATSRPEDAVCIAGSLYVVGEANGSAGGVGSIAISESNNEP